MYCLPNMSKEKEKYKPVFNISVVGLSGTEQFKGESGVGKSCLCNRFVRPIADDYYPEHTSALSQSDFGGRVVSNDMFLYWGEAVKTDDNGLKYKFNIVEQTEFIDDQTYQPHRSSSNQNYYKRCAQTKLSSAEKLMYICTDQLGIENDFEQKPMPEGKLTIDGFLLCFDVSQVDGRSIEDQVKFVQTCYHQLQKTKKPIVLALTKCDERKEQYVKEAEKFASAPGGKKSSIPIVETSAGENINVELAFMVLAQMIDKARSKSKIISYDDASRIRQEILNQATEDLSKLLSVVVKSYKEQWSTARSLLEDKPEYIRVVDLLGKNYASKIFRKHANRLRDEYRMQMQNSYLKYLPRAFKIILPDLSLLGANWQDSIDLMSKQPAFDSWFITLESDGGVPWYENDHVQSLEDRRIPAELLRTPDAENAYLKHRRDLETKQRKHDMKKLYQETLKDSKQVFAGRDIAEVLRYFVDFEFHSELNEAELNTIYKQYQVQITEKAKKDFQELLYECAEVFVNSRTHSDIHAALETDPRYGAMDYMQKERDDILTRHISGMLYPNQDNWGATCLKQLVNRIKKTKPLEIPPPSSKWSLKPDSKTLNVVLLGADGLSRELANEITVQSSEDSYNLDGCAHSLRLRCIDGDVSSPRNSFKTSDFSPHGCIAVYSSMDSFKYMKSSLQKTVLPPSDGISSTPPQFLGLPVSILLACQAGPRQQEAQLRSEGENFAALLGCPFIDVREPEYTYNRRFHESQIRRAMRSLLNGIKERAGSSRNSRTTIEISETNIESDIRIIACTMADDFRGAEVALLPLLNHPSCKVLSAEDEVDKKDKDAASSCSSETLDDNPPVGDSLVIETYLGNQKRSIQVTMTSYHNARHMLNKKQTVHGFLLLFDTCRPASYSVMKVFAKYTVSAYPIQIVCMSSNAKDKFSSSAVFRDETGQRVVIEANKLADTLKARFMTITPNHFKHIEVYTTFFKDAWEHKDETETLNSFNRTVVDGSDRSLNGLEDDFEGLELDLQKDEGSRPVTPDKSFTGQSTQGTSSTESLTCTRRPTTLSNERDPYNSSPASSLSNQLSTSRMATPASPGTDLDTWNMSGDYDPDPISTSPTAGLLANEETPGLSDVQPFTKSSYNSSGPGPGKLNPELVSKVAAVIKPRSKSTQLLHQRSFTEGIHETSQGFYMAFDPKKTGQKVFPNLEAPATHKQEHLKDCHAASSPYIRGKNFLGVTRSKNGHKKKNGDVDFIDGGLHSTSKHNNRYSAVDVKLETETQNMRRGISHEVLHSGIPGYKDFPTAAHTPKEEKRKAKDEEKKRKDEEKKRIDEEKRREKDQQKERRNKGKNNGQHGRHTMGTKVVPNNHNVSEYFNKSLDEIMQGLNHLTPLFVEKCVQYIEQFGLSNEGLYRIPANTKERENVLNKFDEDHSVDLSTLSVTVQTIAGCLTWFFSHKNLPEPLIPPSLHEELEEAIKMPPEMRNLAVRGVVRKLPCSNYVTFKYLCTHLNTVCKHERENKMNSENLAVIWWPTLFRPEVNDVQGFNNPRLQDVLIKCIDQCAYIFYNQKEV